MHNEADRLELPLAIEVLGLRSPKAFPLTLCTWDYVPNRWFPARAKDVLDDMGRHGVNVFPRSTLPPGRVDAADHLTLEWPPLDAELERLQGRGKILFHLGHPPIEFAVKKSGAEKRPTEIAYILALRDHLRERGWGYEDYAFYLLDEPGLDARRWTIADAVQQARTNPWAGVMAKGRALGPARRRLNALMPA